MKEDVNTLLNNLLDNAVEFLPRLFMALLVVATGYILAQIVKRLIRRFILYLDSRLQQRLSGTMLDVDLKSSSSFISGTFFWVILVVALLICVQVLGLEFLGAWLDRAIAYLPNVLVAVIIVFVGTISGRLLGDLAKSAASGTGIANGEHLRRVVRYLLLFISIVIALDQLGIDIVFLKDIFIIVVAALLFGASLAFALGAKTSVSNILGAYYIRKTHQVGTRIRFGDIEGTIVKITDYAVSVETDNGLKVIPAKKFNENDVTVVEADERE